MRIWFSWIVWEGGEVHCMGERRLDEGDDDHWVVRVDRWDGVEGIEICPSLDHIVARENQNCVRMSPYAKLV